jgi:hypothetical protein
MKEWIVEGKVPRQLVWLGDKIGEEQSSWRAQDTL